jgi:hypothetical protein
MQYQVDQHAFRANVRKFDTSALDELESQSSVLCSLHPNLGVLVVSTESGIAYQDVSCFVTY